MIGLVIGRDMPVGTTITEANLSEHICGLVVANDVSARDVQLTKTQFYEAKSSPTFTVQIHLYPCRPRRRSGDRRRGAAATADGR